MVMEGKPSGQNNAKRNSEEIFKQSENKAEKNPPKTQKPPLKGQKKRQGQFGHKGNP